VLPELVVGPRDDVDRHQLADRRGGLRPGLGGGLDRAHVAPHDHRDQAVADPALVEQAGEAILAGIDAEPEDALRPRLLYVDVIEDVTDQHAVIVNRNREASMLLPGQTLLVVEVTPALFAAVAANAAERVAPELTLVTVSMIGAAGRVYLAGATADIVLARDEITRVLEGVRGRDG